MVYRLAIFFLFVTCVITACNSELIRPAAGKLSALEAQGEMVFKLHCANCHATSGETIIVGPSQAGIASRGSQRIPGMDARTYVKNSIINPKDYTVEGFQDNLMPTDYGILLSVEDIEALVAYLLTLDE